MTIPKHLYCSSKTEMTKLRGRSLGSHTYKRSRATTQRRFFPSTALFPVKFGDLAGRFAIGLSRRPIRIETHAPKTHHLKADTTDPRCIQPAATVTNLRQGKQTAALQAIIRAVRKPPQFRAANIIT
jgi:hypothetical protein